MNPLNPLELLAAVGNVVDTPWAMGRNLLAGVNPFQGFLNPEERTTGRGHLEAWGLLGPNQEGLDLGDVAGFGVEMLDPLSLAAGTVAPKLFRGLRGAGRAAEGAEAARAAVPGMEGAGGALATIPPPRAYPVDPALGSLVITPEAAEMAARAATSSEPLGVRAALHRASSAGPLTPSAAPLALPAPGMAAAADSRRLQEIAGGWAVPNPHSPEEMQLADGLITAEEAQQRMEARLGRPANRVLYNGREVTLNPHDPFVASGQPFDVHTVGPLIPQYMTLPQGYPIPAFASPEDASRVYDELRSHLVSRYGPDVLQADRAPIITHAGEGVEMPMNVLPTNDELARLRATMLGYERAFENNRGPIALPGPVAHDVPANPHLQNDFVDDDPADIEWGIPDPRPQAFGPAVPLGGEPSPFYSRLQRAAEAVPGEQIKMQSLRNQLTRAAGSEGVSPEEMDWVLRGLVGEGGLVRKEDLLRHIDENRVQVGERLLQSASRPDTFDLVDIYPDGRRLVTAHGMTREEAERSLAIRRDAVADMGNIAGYTPPASVEIAASAETGATPHLGGGWADPGEPKWQNYSIPGGENYSELVLSLPRRTSYGDLKQELRKIRGELDLLDRRHPVSGRALHDAPSGRRAELEERAAELERQANAMPRRTNYESPHWDNDNVLAHVRFDTRVAPNGDKTLFVHEIQSDWHQAGRRNGYQGQYSDDNLPRFEAVGEEGMVVVPAAALRKTEKGTYQWFDESANRPLETWDGEVYPEYGSIEGAMEAYLQTELGERLVPNAPMKGNEWANLALKRILQHAADNGYQRIAFTNGPLAASYSAGGATGKAAEGIAKWYDETVPNLMAKLLKKEKVRMEAMPIEVAGQEHIVSSFAVPQATKQRIASQGQPLWSLLPLVGAGGLAGGAAVANQGERRDA